MPSAPRTPTVRQAAILVGGLGARLGSLTANTPKPLMTCGDRPFLAWLLRELCRFGVEEALLLTGHLAGVVEDALPAIKATLPKPLKIRCVREEMPAGTGGALHNAREHLAERFLLLNGDSYFDFNWARALAARVRDEPGVVARMILRPLADASRYGVAELSGDRVVGFHERPPAAHAAGLINSGVYLLDRRVLEAVAPVCSLERDVLPKLAQAGAVHATVADGYFIDIGVPEDLERARAELPDRLTRRALFLGDGVISRDHGNVGERGRFEFVEGARDLIAAAADLGWHVFMVTNPSGIGQGPDSQAAIAARFDRMMDEIRAGGGNIDDVCPCPHHPDAVLDDFRRVALRQEPGPEALNDLLARWRLDPARCLFVCDQPSRMKAAADAGIAGHLFPGGDLSAFVGPLLEA